MIIRALLVLIGGFFSYYIFNWHIAVWLGLPCITLPWFILLGIVVEYLGNFSYYTSYNTKHKLK